METILAKASMDRVSMRDPNKTYHIMTRQEVAQLAPNFAWDQYFQATGAPAFETLNVSQPDYIKQIAVDLANSSIDSWRAYFAYHLLRQSAPALPEAFENEAFDFWSRYLSGTKEQRPRPARCVAAVDRQLGDLLGQKYIELTFGADAKAQITQLVDALEKAMAEDIRTLPWMTEETKKAALAKLKAITNNVGAPKKWRDYGKLTIARDDFFGNAMRDRAGGPTTQRIEKIGKPTDKTEWGMTTPTVNAFYSPQNNSINFPAGILQTPCFRLPTLDLIPSLPGALTQTLPGAELYSLSYGTVLAGLQLPESRSVTAAVWNFWIKQTLCAPPSQEGEWQKHRSESSSRMHTKTKFCKGNSPSI